MTASPVLDAGPADRSEATGRAVTTRLREQARTPLVRAGLHLVASAGVTSVLGLAFWSLAARRYSPAALGATAGLLAAMEVIAAIANLGLRSALTRFVPSLGDQARRVVAVSYAVSGTAASICALGFVLVHRHLFPELTLLDDPVGAAFFTVSTALWVLFSLQDSVLIGLRRSSWLPIENAVFALVKLGLLVALVTPLPEWGIYVAWTAPLALFVLVVNAAAFPRLGRSTAGTERLGVPELIRYSAGDYAASALWLATIDGLPLLVLALAGATASAGYHLAWTVAYTLFLVPSAVGSALLAEAAHDGPRLDANARRALGLSLGLVVPGALIIAVVAPLLLSVFGATYADDVGGLLRLMALSAIPYAVNNLHVSLDRARRNLASVVRFFAVFCGALLALSAVLVPHLGAAGTGVAWLVVQCTFAGWVILVPRRDLWIRSLPTPVLRAAGAPIGRWHQARRRRRGAELLAEVVPRISPDAERWSLIHATSDLVIGRIESAHRPAEVLKLPVSHVGELSRRREMATLASLHADPRTERWSVAAPSVLSHGTLGDRVWSRETDLPSRSGVEALAEGLRPHALLLGGAALVSGLHRATAVQRTVDTDRFQAWVVDPARAVASACPEAARGLDELVATLHPVLAGATVTVSRTHGDVSPANLRVDRDGAVTGLVDWEAASVEGLPEIDLLGLIASTRSLVDTREYGEVVDALLHRPWNEEEVAVLDAGPNRHLPRSALVLVAWLHHVATNVTKSDAYAGNRAWVVRNVLSVADALAEVAPSSGPSVSMRTVPAVATVAPPPSDLTTDRLVAPAPPPPRRARDRAGRAPDRAPGHSGHATRRGATIAAWSVPVIAVLTWFAAVGRVDPRALSDIGLVSAVHPLGFVALVVLALGFTLTLRRRPFPEGLAATHVGALVTILFATPAIAYPTVRYAWSWKHMGIIDYIGRHGSVDPGIDVLPIYHNWPGFFAGNDVLRAWLGADTVVTIARWSPFVLTLVTVGAVCLLAATFTTDRRAVWLTAWLFVLGDWVGQEYFSPQSLAYLLYIVVIALALRISRARGAVVTSTRQAPAALAALLVLVGAISISHQITPAMLCAVLLGLALTRRARLLGVSLVALVLTVLWAMWGAADFVAANVKMILEGFGSPMANAEGNLVDTSAISDGQALVTTAGRLVVVALATLALWGVIRTWRRDRAACITLVIVGAAPLAILATNEFGGEILFRVYLFALPVAAWFGAQALLDPPGTRRRRGVLLPMVVSGALLAGFLLAHFGKDGHYAFTRAEQDAATWLYEQAPDDSLLVEGSSNYPVQLLDYEHFRYVPLDSEDLSARREMAADPVGVLSRWMSDDRDAAAYLLITRSQRREAEVMGHRPPGFLEGLEATLLASDRFSVAFRNEDAIVFTLRDRDR